MSDAPLAVDHVRRHDGYLARLWRLHRADIVDAVAVTLARMPPGAVVLAHQVAPLTIHVSHARVDLDADAAPPPATHFRIMIVTTHPDLGVCAVWGDLPRSELSLGPLPGRGGDA